MVTSKEGEIPRTTPALMLGFTLIELMIVIATTAVILTLALPVYSNYAIRAKMGEALSLGNSAVTAISSACLGNINISALTKSLAGYGLTESTDDDAYVRNIEASGPCTAAVITITTKNTGASPDPVLILTGKVRPGGGKIEWRCSSTSPNHLLPSTCRS